MERTLFARRREALGKTTRVITRELESHGLDVTQSAVGMWERGENFPSADKWIAIMAVYGVSQKQLSDAAIAFKRPAASVS